MDKLKAFALYTLSWLSMVCALVVWYFLMVNPIIVETELTSFDLFCGKWIFAPMGILFLVEGIKKQWGK